MIVVVVAAVDVVVVAALLLWSLWLQALCRRRRRRRCRCRWFLSLLFRCLWQPLSSEDGDATLDVWSAQTNITVLPVFCLSCLRVVQ